MEIQIHPEALVELGTLPPREHAAMLNAIRKLEAIGDALGHPHSSHVQGSRIRGYGRAAGHRRGGRSTAGWEMRS